MKYYKTLLRSFLFCAIGVFAVSCVKDVDLDQAQDIGLSPDIQTDLLIYDVDESDFMDPETKEMKQVIMDTVRLEFLDDDYIQNDLTALELNFIHQNSFPQAFDTKVRFLSESNREQFRVEYTVVAGSETDPATTEITKMVSKDEIGKVKRSIKMVVELEPKTNGKEFAGELQFASKGLFRFQF
ncbi:MAG: hypothetical protein WCE57_07010 [Salegentibacter sp.]